MLINEGDIVTLTLEDDNGDPFTLVLNNVIYLSTSRYNLLFISKLIKAKIIRL